jgi:hypothetical protein
LHEPQVWNDLAVQRAHPMAWFVGGVVLLWYARYGPDAEQAQWQRPWYNKKVEPTFADMLATLRLHLWQNAWNEASPEQRTHLLGWLFHYVSTAMG